jgi:hypothetical protein
MHREDEYKHLAKSTRQRGAEEQNALLRAQWEILAATYVRLADQSKKVGNTGTPAVSHLRRISRKSQGDDERLGPTNHVALVDR